MPGDRILSAPRLGILSDPALRPESAGRDLVLGLVLDQRRRKSGTRLHRSADGPYIDDPVDWRQHIFAACQLRQSDRRLDVRLPCIRVRRSGRVRRGKRVCTSKTGAAEAAVRAASGAASNVDNDVDNGDDCSAAVDEGSTASDVDEGSAAGDSTAVTTVQPPSTREVPPVTSSREVPPVTSTRDVPPVTSTSEVPPVTSTREVPPATDAPPRRPRLLPGIASLLPGLDVGCLEQVTLVDCCYDHLHGYHHRRNHHGDQLTNPPNFNTL